MGPICQTWPCKLFGAPQVPCSVHCFSFSTLPTFSSSPRSLISLSTGTRIIYRFMITAWFVRDTVSAQLPTHSIDCMGQWMLKNRFKLNARTKTVTINPWAFALSSPMAWSNLPEDFCDSSLIFLISEKKLKTHLFNCSFVQLAEVLQSFFLWLLGSDRYPCETFTRNNIPAKAREGNQGRYFLWK